MNSTARLWAHMVPHGPGLMREQRGIVGCLWIVFQVAALLEFCDLPSIRNSMHTLMLRVEFDPKVSRNLPACPIQMKAQMSGGMIIPTAESAFIAATLKVPLVDCMVDKRAEATLAHAFIVTVVLSLGDLLLDIFF